MKLRTYQSNLIEDIRKEMRKGIKNIVLQAPTGCGKTVLTAFMIKETVRRNHECLFIVHRRELIEQSAETFEGVEMPYGIIASGYPENLKEKIQICSVQSLARRLHKIRYPKLMIWDECHHLGARTWGKIHAMFPKAYHVGLTATPKRLDGKGLDKYFDHLITGPKVQDLIDTGFLSDYKIYAPPGPDFSKCHKRMGDYSRAEIGEIMESGTVLGSTVEQYKRWADGKQTLIFCTCIKHSLAVAESFNKAGYIAYHLDGDTPKKQRDTIIKGFKRGEIKIITNCDLFGEGLDVPSLECVQLCRPTLSLALYRQQVGRSLRPFEGKDHAIIIDQVGNVSRHGLPCQDIEWDLKGKAKKDASAGPKICPECFYANKPASTECECCGFIFPVESKRVIPEELAGHLQEIDKATFKMKRIREQSTCRTFSELVALGKSRNYKYPVGWAKHVMKSRGRNGQRN